MTSLPEDKSNNEKVTFVTGNVGKLREFQEYFGHDIGKHFVNKDIDLEEIQGTPEEIIRAKLLKAREVVKGPLVVEDTSMGFHAYHLLPGPYIKHFLKSCGCQGLIDMLEGKKDKSAQALCVIGFLDSDTTKCEIFIGKCEGEISPEVRGKNNFGWDPIFIPLHERNKEKLTFAQLDIKIKNEISHRGNALKLFQSFIEQWSKKKY
ncbi:inosine triphosphate pyrophosphatase [Reticulomyxa filosa]|uniref:XTP/dITP diphosphatase n=1 Tax=Reticulomyxa filosa TaxID=46433 RepID=X6NXT5_RETFI|nr:inosine triphosphate pyrophosphatase [Reticulomyxa filosa]|eukprot:ETO30639.1 inosine triphosphate pyrophosphatase [Reticulomyxa filosa]